MADAWNLGKSMKDFHKQERLRPKSLRVSFECPHCKQQVTGFLGVWEHGEVPPLEEHPILLKPCVCDSGGLYACYVECPKCEQDIVVM